MGKPLAIILMATYNPDLSWFREQLASIDHQTYENIQLFVCDDCSSAVDREQLETIIKQYITRFPYRFIRNEINLGTNKTFERLTSEASHIYHSENLKEVYFSYCDQDDVWENNKTEALMNAVNQKSAVLAYSDMSVIDGEGNFLSDSITKVRKRFRYYEGDKLWKRILVHNFISGCCMIIRADVAKAAIPFEVGMQRDRWLSVVASLNGSISYVDEPLVRYRQHGGNQTGVLKGITDKRTYIDVRLRDHLEMLRSVRNRIKDHDEFMQFLDDYIEQTSTRYEYAAGEGIVFLNLVKMIRGLKWDRSVILFETVALKLPDWLFNRVLEAIRNRNL